MIEFDSVTIEDMVNVDDSVDRFLSDLRQYAFESRAVQHPYLSAFSAGDFPDNEAAFKDFAAQYGLYSSKFTKFVSSVIGNLSNPAHKAILLENLREEQGSTHDVVLPPAVLKTVVDQPHSLLFMRFQKALGAKIIESSERMEDEPGFKWAAAFSQLCSSNQYVGVGAVGIGTELIVSKMYQKILTGIRAHTELTPVEHVFFDLHSECDDEHAEQLLDISRDIAATEEARRLIAFGVKKALDLRVEFWDAMLERAEAMAHSEDRVIGQE